MVALQEYDSLQAIHSSRALGGSFFDEIAALAFIERGRFHCLYQLGQLEALIDQVLLSLGHVSMEYLLVRRSLEFLIAHLRLSCHFFHSPAKLPGNSSSGLYWIIFCAELKTKLEVIMKGLYKIIRMTNFLCR